MPCKASAPAWSSFKEHNPSFKFEDVDVDTGSDIAEKYGVMSVPTVLLIEDEKILKTRVGSFSEKDLNLLVV